MGTLLGKRSASVYFYVLILCTTLILWGNFTITLCSILLATFWTLNGNFRSGFKTLIQRKTSLLYLVICALILGRVAIQLLQDEAVLIFTAYLPLLIFIVAIGSQKELPHGKFNSIMLVFVAAIVINTVYCSISYLINYTDTLNFRRIGLFMSHIRLSLFAVMGIATCTHYLFFNRELETKRERIFLWISLSWLVIFIVLSKVIIAYTILGFLLLIFIFLQLKKHNSMKVKALIVALFFLGIAGIAAVLYGEARYFISRDVYPSKITEKTRNGNEYNTLLNKQTIENGHYAGIYICKKEIDSCWLAATGISLYEVNKQGYPLYTTLYRYMASKNLRKDAEGFAQLTNDDITNVIDGFTNYRFTSNFSIRKRIYEAFWEIYEYANNGDANDHSITQRIEFLKCATKTIQKYPWFGVGAMAKKEMAITYHETNSPLSKSHWNLPHNQFMLMGVMTGIVGLVIFIACLVGLIVYSRKKWNAITISWFAAMILSFFSEDTMNTHAGLAFCAYFGALVLFAQPEKEQ